MGDLIVQQTVHRDFWEEICPNAPHCTKKQDQYGNSNVS